MTEPQTSGRVEYGVEYAVSDGEPFTAGGYTLAGARFVVTAADAGFQPRPSRVMQRTVGEWEPVESTEAKTG